MLTAIINNQSAMKQDLIERIDRLEDKFNDLQVSVENNGKRIDKLGMQIAELSDDAPTLEEFEGLEGRVKSLEKQFASH